MQQDTETIQLGDEHAWGGVRRPFSIPASVLCRHAYILGQTGTGKSTTLIGMLAQLIAHGHGVAFLDPHGTAAEELLARIPRRRFRDVVYFAPKDLAWPIGLNLLEDVHPDHRHLVASSIVEAFRNLYSSWGPRLEHILYHALRALLDATNSTLLWVPRLLLDAPFRTGVVEQVRDPAVRAFWTEEFAQMGRNNKRLTTEAVSPVLNKLGQLASHPPLRNILGQRFSSIDAGFMLERRRIFIADLSAIGTASCNLIGSLLLTWFQTKAMERTNRPEGEKPLFFIASDESHRFSTASIATALSEIRKAGAAMLLASQFGAQWSDEVRNAIWGNVGTVLAFRVGGSDAEHLAQEWGGSVLPGQLTDLGRFQAFVKTLEAGEPLGPVKVTMRAPLRASHTHANVLMRESRRRYGNPRNVIERRIAREIGAELGRGR